MTITITLHTFTYLSGCLHFQGRKPGTEWKKEPLANINSHFLTFFTKVMHVLRCVTHDSIPSMQIILY